MVAEPVGECTEAWEPRCSGVAGADNELLPPAYDRPKLICIAVAPSAPVVMRFTMRRSVNSLQWEQVGTKRCA